MHSSTRTLLFLGTLWCLVATGCTNLPRYKASEFHMTITYPLVFTETIDATGITKTTRDNGDVVRKAANLTHSTTVMGFVRTAVYKDAEIVEKPEKP